MKRILLLWIARVMGQQLQEALGQPFVVENKRSEIDKWAKMAKAAGIQPE
jgi:hypothetical protein